MSTTVDAVRAALNEILADPGARAQLGIVTGISAADRERLDSVEQQVGTLMADYNLAAAGLSSVWMNGASIVNGTVTAEKVSVNSLEAITINTGDLNLTGTLTIAASYPATGARITMDQTNGFRLYTGPATTAIRLNMDGSGEIGPNGGNKISWDTTPTISIPAAIISSLTIADVGSGTMGGTYQTGAGSTRIDISTSGIVMYASGSETFRLNSSTGAMTATGSFTVKSAASGARVEISNAGGIVGYNASSTETFRFNAATGEGFVGTTGQINWSSSGTVSIGGVALSGGKITASSLSVSTLSSISANIGTITAGTINAAAMTVQNLSAASINTGNLGGGIGLGTSDLTVGSTGKIKFGQSSADYLANDILHFDLTSTQYGKVRFKSASYNRHGVLFGYDNGSTVTMGLTTYNTMPSAPNYYATLVPTSAVWLYNGTGIYMYAGDTAGSNASDITMSVGSSNYIRLGTAGGIHTTFENSNRAIKARGRYYPGTGSAEQSTYYYYAGGAHYFMGANIVGEYNIYPGNQTSRGIQYDSGSGELYVSGNYLYIFGNNSAGNPMLRFSLAYTSGSSSAWSSYGPGTSGITSTSTTYALLQIGATKYRFPIWADS